MCSLPFELLDLIACNLTNSQQCKCLLVSKTWYKPFQRALYKTIKIKSRHQFKLLFEIFVKRPSLGLFVCQIYFSKQQTIHNSTIKMSNTVGITSQELNGLVRYCPNLEVLDFDQKIWKYLGAFPQQTSRLVLIPTLTTEAYNPNKKCFSASNRMQNLSRLNLSGEIVSNLFTNQHLIPLLTHAGAQVKSLCLDSRQSKSHVIPLTINDMELIHQACPLLKELQLIGSFKCLEQQQQLLYSQVRSVKKRSDLNRLQISCTTLQDQWIEYIANTYKGLQQLELEIQDNENMYMYHKKDESATPSNCNKIKKADYFVQLIHLCTQLRKISLDSLSAKKYLTLPFFVVAKKHSILQEINLLSENLPFHSIYRDNDDGFFDMLVLNGKELITGLRTEVIESDIHISSILNPLSSFTQLVQLVLCCGHPLFDCAIDLILNSCHKLRNLTIRSAHVQLSSSVLNNSSTQQHLLKSLSLNTVFFDSNVFQYLGKHCHHLNQLSFYECDQQGADNSIDIYMPHNDFLSIVVNCIRLDNSHIRPQNHTLWMARNSCFLDIRTPTLHRLYHVYNSYPGKKSKIQRLNDRKSQIASHYYQSGWIQDDQKESVQHIRVDQNIKHRAHVFNQQHQRSINYTRSSSSSSNHEWECDLFFGKVSVVCRSIKYWELRCDTIYEF